jgi:uncharacterized membrane protein
VKKSCPCCKSVFTAFVLPLVVGALLCAPENVQAQAPTSQPQQSPYSPAAIDRGQIVGISETTVQEPGCSPSKPGKIISPVFWERGEVRALPTVARDPDGFVQGINDQVQAVGSSGTCTNIAIHAVLWENDTAFELPNLGQDGNDAYAINDHGQAVGYVSTTDGTTIVASLWPNGVHSAVTNLGILPGDGAAFATGINNRGQVVGSTFNSAGWSAASSGKTM